MRTTFIISMIVSFFLISYLFAMAYYSEETTKTWKNKYFANQAAITEQSNRIEEISNDKTALLRQATELNLKVQILNNQLAELRNQVQANTSKLSQGSNELVVNKEKSNLVTVCPKPKTIIKYKRIPYDIAPSQQ